MRKFKSLFASGAAICLTAILVTAYCPPIFAQAPFKIHYQTVVHDQENRLICNKTVGVEIKIFHQDPLGPTVYSQSCKKSTNENGLISMAIGEDGSDEQLKKIDWSNGPYFIETAIDPDGNENYIIKGVHQLLSVPYAIHSKTADNLSTAIEESDPVFMSSIAAEITSSDTLYWNQKIDTITGNEEVFNLWDKDASDDFDGDYSNLRNKPNLSDTANYLKNETQGLQDVLAINNIANNRIRGLSMPQDPEDAVPKAYIDSLKDELDYLIETILLEKNFYINSDTTGYVRDVDGNTYPLVRIGNQWWMAENLRTTHYADGSQIPQISDPEGWESLAVNQKAYCFHEFNSTDFAKPWGAYYTWAAAMNGEAGDNHNPGIIQGVCPEGFHLPSDKDWQELEAFLGMDNSDLEREGYNRGENLGLLLMSIDKWIKIGGGNNKTGFTAYPAGIVNTDGNNGYFHSSAEFWSSTLKENNMIFVRSILYHPASIDRVGRSAQHGVPVRCIKN